MTSDRHRCCDAEEGPITHEGGLRTEAAYRESEQRFRTLVEASLTGISIVQDDQVVYQNPEQARLLGPLPRANKLLDRSSIHPDDAAKVEAYYNQLVEGAHPPADIDFRFYPPDGAAAGTGLKWVHCRAVTIRYQGRPALLINMMDITPTKEMAHLLRVKDKMSSLGQVTAGIAHEIRNPLSGINIYLNTLEKLHQKAAPDEKIDKILRQLRSASGKIESVIKRVMDFARPSVPRLVLGDPRLPIDEAVGLSQVALRKRGVTIEVHTEADLPACRIDPTLMEEVLLNLITNAAEALKTNVGEKRIRVAAEKAEKRVRITVSDNGPGIPIALTAAIFDPFYTTKEGNTGIGLSMCRRITSLHGGGLTVTPKGPHGGAAFRIDLPIPEDGAPFSGAETAPEGGAQGERVSPDEKAPPGSPGEDAG